MKFDEHQFLMLEQAGQSAAQIAAELGVTTRTIQRWRGKVGTVRDRTPIRPVSDHDRAAELLDEGCSFSEVAATVGVSWRTIKRWFPDRNSWTAQQAGEWSALVRRMGAL